MENKRIPAGWGLWFHGTTHNFEAFDDDKRLAQLSNDCNAGLGHFLAATISGAARYVTHSRECGGTADVLIVAALETHRYCASPDDFWCRGEVLAQEPEDPLGLLPAGGLLTREKLMAQGYRSIGIDDLEGLGAVIAMFEATHLRILKRLPVSQAERLEAWLQAHHGEVTEPNARYALIEAWCEADSLANRRTLAAVARRLRAPTAFPLPA